VVCWLIVQAPTPFMTAEEFEVWPFSAKIHLTGPQKEAIRHVETTLARSMYNCDEK
jgi:hypothetical protein